MNESQIKESLASLRFHSTASLVLVLIAASIFAFTLYYSASRLTPLEIEIAALTSKIESTKTDLQEAQAGLLKANRELGEIQEKTKNARSSFVFVQQGLRQFFVKDFANAITFYDKAINQDSTNPILFDLRGYALLRVGRVEEAIASLEKCVSLAPDYVWGHYNLALAYGKLNDPRALDHVKTVLKLDPSMRDKIRGDGQFQIFKSNQEYRALIGNG
jgi:tetratricopeptide (TPR) repeat protein